MALISKSRTIRPSSRAESSTSYKIDTKNVLRGDTLEVTVTHESRPFRQTYVFAGDEIYGRNSISFRVKETKDKVDIVWSTAPKKQSAAENKILSKEKTVATASPSRRGGSDEHYILDLCDVLLSEKGLRQHTFDFLRGDTGRKLPVDAFYLKHNLVIEYCERQQTEAVNFFDRKITASGISRGEQRKKYDLLRAQKIRENQIGFVSLDYSEFPHKSNKRLLRDKEQDIKILKSKLRKYLKS